MNTKIINLPNCFDDIKKATKEDEYERVVHGFYHTRNYTIQEINNVLYLNNRKLLSMSEDFLVESNIVTCSNLKKKYDFESVLCQTCDFNKQKIKNKNGIPMNIRESLILNLAQQNNQILQAIDPEKVISLAKIGERHVKIYREFYYYLKKENVTIDKNILIILKKIYFANKEIPANIKDVNLLLDFLFEDKIHKIKMLNKNIRKPLKVTQSTDIKQQLDSLSLAKYIALDFKNEGRVMAYSENSTEVYDLNLLNIDVVCFVNKILNNKGIKTIVRNIEIHNVLKQYKLTVRNLVPMDIVYSSLNINEKKLNFEDIINKFICLEDRIDIKLLSYVTFSLNTNHKIKVENVKDGFYNIKALKTDSKSTIIEFDTKIVIDSINNKSISYKDFYYNIAYFINKYTSNHKYSNKLKFNVLEISDKFILSTDKDTKKYVLNLVFLACYKVVHSFSDDELSPIRFSFEYK